MRILRVAQKVYPDVVGGGPYHVHALSRDQAAMGHDVTVLTVRREAGQPAREERDGYTVVRQDPTVSPLGNDVSVGLARALWNAEGVDVVHAHSHLYFATNVAALRRRFGDVPLAITNHGLYSQSAPQWLFDGYLRTLGRWTFDRADVVFTYTEAEREQLRERGVGTRIEVVHNGIDVERFSREGPTAEAFESDGPTLLFVGRLVEGKRPADVVRATAGLADDHPDLSLAIVGDGPLRADLATAASDAGIADRVHFLGHVDYDRMPAVYRAADLLVLPSETEGFPRTVMEAMATGTPVVTSALPQLEAVVGTAGATFPTGDVAALTATLDDLLADESRRRDLGASGPELVRQRYAWAETVAETTAHLEHLLER